MFYDFLRKYTKSVNDIKRRVAEKRSLKLLRNLSVYMYILLAIFVLDIFNHVAAYSVIIFVQNLVKDALVEYNLLLQNYGIFLSLGSKLSFCLLLYVSTRHSLRSINS